MTPFIQLVSMVIDVLENMDYTHLAVLRREADGAIAYYDCSDIDPTGKVPETIYWWTDGNFGCDCNRGMCFDRAIGISEETIAERDYSCGETRYTLLQLYLSGKDVLNEQPDSQDS